MGRTAFVCIDPGHGGNDPGAVGDGGLREADVALAVAKELCLRLSYHNTKTKLTRTDDSSMSLAARVDATVGCDLMVSVHCNAARSPHPEGFEVIYPSKDGQSIALSNHIDKAMAGTLDGHRNRGIKGSPSQAYGRNLYILRMHRVPTVIVETEFISNRRWEVWLGQVQTHQQLAEAICKGICAYLRERGFSTDGQTTYEASELPDYHKLPEPEPEEPPEMAEPDEDPAEDANEVAQPAKRSRMKTLLVKFFAYCERVLSWRRSALLAKAAAG